MSTTVQSWSFTNELSPVIGRDPLPSPSAVTIERADGEREKVARTGTITPDYSSASASSIYAAGGTNRITTTVSRMPYSTTIAAQTPCKRKQNENAGGTTDKDQLGVPNDACYNSKRSVMCGSHP